MRLAAFVPLLVACQNEQGFVDPGQAFGEPNPQVIENEVRTDRLVQLTIPVVDALFVVDNSCSMDAEQALLSANFRDFLEWFQRSGLDYHIGVVSTDMVDPLHAGRLRSVDGRRWVDAATPTPESLFSEMVQMGTNGHWEEKGRAAAYTALEVLREEDNQGFLRPDSGVHVTVVADENDASGESPISRTEFIDWMNHLRWSQQQVSFSSIVGPLSGCPYVGSPGIEYMEVTRNVGGVVWPICDEDWSDMLDELGFLAVGLSREFFLSARPVVGTVDVKVEDGPTVLTFEETEDWVYDAVRNSVVFLTFVPDPLSTVVVTYEVRSSDQGPSDPGGTTPNE